MKKLILSLVLVGMLIGFSPAVKAVDLPPISQLTQSEKTQWIQLLVQMISLLQEQLKVMVAQEVALNKIVENTAPKVVENSITASSAPIMASPKKMQFGEDFPAVGMERVDNSATLIIRPAQAGDVVTYTFNGNTSMEVVNVPLQSGNLGKYYAHTFYELTPSTEYSVEVKLERGNQYAIRTLIFSTYAKGGY